MSRQINEPKTRAWLGSDPADHDSTGSPLPRVTKWFRAPLSSLRPGSLCCKPDAVEKKRQQRPLPAGGWSLVSRSLFSQATFFYTDRNSLTVLWMFLRNAPMQIKQFQVVILLTLFPSSNATPLWRPSLNSLWLITACFFYSVRSFCRGLSVFNVFVKRFGIHLDVT